MGCVGRNLLRIGVIGVLVAGAAVAIAGPQRLAAVGQQARQTVHRKIDRHISDPVAYREQLRQLEAQYPQRISEVERDLAELREQAAELDRQREQAERVAQIARRDLNALSDALAAAEDRHADLRGSAGIVPASVAYNNPERVAIRFRGDLLDINRAYTAATEVARVRDAYTERVIDLETHLSALRDQESRLTEVASTLREEQARFQDELWQLERQIDSIARNDRLIDMLERRRARIDEFSRYEAASLDQIKSRLSEKRSSQDARLASLTSQNSATTYEQKARIEIERERRGVRTNNREQTASPNQNRAERLTVIDADANSASDTAGEKDDEDDHQRRNRSASSAPSPFAARGL